MLHRTRQLFIRQQISVINAIRAHMAEFGIVAPVGRQGVEVLLEVARMAWAMMAKEERYKEPVALAARTRSRRT
jgi:hypothetical protein